MLKKIFSVLCTVAVIIFAAHSSASANAVSVVLDTPEGQFAEPEKVYTAVQNTLDNIFKNAPFEVKSVSECDAYVQIYREENDRAGISETNYDYASARDLTFKKADIQNMCNHFGDDYLVYIRVATTNPRSTGGVFTSGRKVNVITDFRIWSRVKNDFVYMARKTTVGGSDTVNISIFGRGSGSTEHAVEKGLLKGLAEVEKDKSKILAAMGV